MEILEVNDINRHLILQDFSQGHNSDGNERNLKFKIDIKPNESRANDIRNKRIEDSNRGEHLRAKSYNTEREGMKNYLPKQADDQKRISHSVEVKRRTIASLRPPEDTPLTVFSMHGGNASGISFPACTVP